MYAKLEDIKMGKVVKLLHFDENPLRLQQIFIRYFAAKIIDVSVQELLVSWSSCFAGA